MYMKFKDGKSKALTLSYDDGSIHDIKMVNILDKFGIKATLNIQSSDFYPEDGEKDGQWKMKISEMKELFKSGNHELAIHGYHHPFFSMLRSEKVLTEVLDDRRKLESEMGMIVRGMAYAFGSYNDEVVDCLKKCGVCYSRTVDSTERFYLPDEWLKWHPTCHHKNPKLFDLAKEFMEKKDVYEARNHLFYLWGHSHEFERDKNWDILEKFCEYASGKDDIWYATNIEIYDYVKAYENLQTSVDEKIIHNPTNQDIWFVEKHANNKEILCVKAGETLKLD